MNDRIVRPAHRFFGKPAVPGDKSISHRALIFGAMAEGTTLIDNLLDSADVQSTSHCLQQMGIQITNRQNLIEVQGKGLQGLKTPRGILNCGNSGTTMRLLVGLLAGQQNMSAELTGDSSLIGRPMKRVADPLRSMGADIELTNQDFAPIKVQGRHLQGINYELKIASAQIKTALLLAGLTAEGKTKLTGQIHSRDHTERLLRFFGAEINTTEIEIQIFGGPSLRAQSLEVPGDPSAAAFWLAGACLLPDAKIEMQKISLNPTRLGFVRVLQKMGARIEIEMTSESPEPMGRLRLSFAPLRGVRLSPAEIPSMIDELPILAVLATQAEGVTEVLGAEELRVKETDRIEAIATNLRAMGGEIEIREDGFLIRGKQKLRGGIINSFHDHRIAMAFSMAALVAQGESLIQNADCVRISYPDFFKTLESLSQ